MKSVLYVRKMYFYQLLAGFLLISLAGVAQPESKSVKLTFSERKIGLDQTFRISVHLSGFTVKHPPEFPQISGFDQGEVNIRQPNSTTDEQVFTQHYLPRSTGIFMLRIFRVEVGAEQVSSERSLMITVEDREKADTSAPATELLNPSPEATVPYFSTKDGGALVTQVNKSSLFVGEELTAELYFYQRSNSRIPLEFPENFYSQVSDLSEQLHPASCWEDRFGIEKPVREQVKIRGVTYDRYRLYRVLLYPLSSQEVVLPSVRIEMLKPDLSKNYSRWQLSPRTPVTFMSNQVRIPVKDLPEHPLSGQVAVGNFVLEEGVSEFSLNTGDPLGYRFSIEGYGNLKAARPPSPPESRLFETYPPEVEDYAYRQQGGMYRLKSVRYTLIAQEPGKYAMGDLFQWIYFNTQTARYDTLRGALEVAVSGEPLLDKKVREQNNSMWGRVSNQLRGVGRNPLSELWGINVLIIGMAVVALILLVRRSK